MRVLAVPGSLRRRSYNRGLLAAMGEQAPGGVDVVLFEGLADVPPFNEDHEDLPEPPGLARWRTAVREADLVVIATPEYNTTVPGQLKNAIDWASRPFGAEAALWNVPVAVMGASSTGYGAVWSQEHLRKALAKAGARVLSPQLAVPRAAALFGEDGALASEPTRRRVAAFLEQALAELLAAPGELAGEHPGQLRAAS